MATSAVTRVDPAELTPDRLRAAVREAMTMGDGAQRVADGFARPGGPAAAAVEGVLAPRGAGGQRSWCRHRKHGRRSGVGVGRHVEAHR